MTTKAQVIEWLHSGGGIITPPPPPPSGILLRENSHRWFDPRLTMPQHATSNPIRSGFAPPHSWVSNSPRSDMGQASGQNQGEFKTLHTANTIFDNQSNEIVKLTTLNSIPVFRYEIRKAWPTWYSGNTTSRARIFTSEVGVSGTGALLRATKTYWTAFSCRWASGGAVPWPGINQIVLDWKQPTGIGQQSQHNSQPRLELTPGGIIRLQRLQLNAGETTINDLGTNASPTTLWSKQMVLDRWYHWVFRFRLAGRAADGPVLQGWLAEEDGPLTQIVNDAAPNSYHYVGTDAFTFLVWGIYNWDVNRSPGWDKQVMYTGLATVFEDGFGTPVPTAANMHATLMDLF